MSVKKTILSILPPDRLRQIIGDLGINPVDRRSTKAMRAALSKARRATPAVLLGYLSERQVKEISKAAGMPKAGDRAALVSALLEDLGSGRGTASKSDGGQPMAVEKSDQGVGRTRGSSPIVISKTEIVWPGKYNTDASRKEVPHVSLPFQVIERVNETRATREARSVPQMSLFDVYEGKEGETFEEGWENKLIWGDNLLVMSSLLERFAGKVDLIYIDPPFATGADFSFNTEVGDSDLVIEKEQSIIEEKAYRDTWGGGDTSYLQMMSDRLVLMRELLADNGSLFLHCDWHVGHYLKVLCDEIFGRESLANEIAWCYTGPGSPGMRQFNRKHDTIFWLRKGKEWKFNANEIRTPHDDKTLENFKRGLKGSGFVAETYDLAAAGKIPEDWWFMAIAARYPVDGTRRTGWATEKPWPLIERIVRATSEPGDIVADFFCGSGTTMAVAESLGRRWIGCDLSRFAIHFARKRLLSMRSRPFELLNLGKYERQYWQIVRFSQDLNGDGQLELYEYLSFILRLYGASPVSGLTYLHGKKSHAMVHVGAVDAPVTIDEINKALDECVQMKRPELHVLGWEWEMGLAGPNNDYRKGGLMHEVAKAKGVKLSLLQIPREVMEEAAVTKGDLQFFELAYVEVEIKTEKLTVTVQLRDFVIPNTDLIPEEVREKVTKWSDYIDYWAIDWDFRNDTFMQGWVTYRTPKNRALTLTSGSHAYEKPGKYRILVKVIDIFGNDTSQAYDVSVR